MSARASRFLKRQNRSTSDGKDKGEKRKRKDESPANQDESGKKEDLADCSEKCPSIDKNNAGENSAEDASILPNISHDLSPKHPTLIKVIHTKDGGKKWGRVGKIEIFIIDTTTVILIACGSTLKTYDEASGEEVGGRLDLCSVNSLTKIQRHIAGVLSFKRQLKMVQVHPTLKLTKTIDLKGEYSVLKFKKDKTLIALKIISQYETVPTLIDIEGNTLKTFRSSLMKVIPLPSLCNMCITPKNDIVAVDSSTNLIICFSETGTKRFVYPTSDEDPSPNSNSYLTSIACDSHSNIYLAWTCTDPVRSEIMKIDVNGNFVEYLWLGDDVKNHCGSFTVQVDENDILYIGGSGIRFGGDVMIYGI